MDQNTIQETSIVKYTTIMNFLRKKKLIKLTFVICVVCLIVIYVQYSQNSTVIKEQQKAVTFDYHNPLPMIYAKKTKSSASCVIPLYSIHNVSHKSTPGTCQRVAPAPGSCEVAKKLFHSAEVDTCSHQKKFEICKRKTLFPGHYVYKCHIPTACKGPSLLLGLTNENTGSLQWFNLSSPAQLASKLGEITHHSSTRNHFGFCFIKCLLIESNYEINVDKVDVNFLPDLDEMDYLFGTQLLVLPPRMIAMTTDEKLKLQNQQMPLDDSFNLNIILIDSVSRSHFYRSLPKTVQELKNINKSPNIPTQVFDFEIAQALKARTFESLEALFTGQVNLTQKPFATLDLPPKPLGVEVLFAPLKQHGYRTLFLEDLCWTWEWGISKDLRVHNKSLSKQQTWNKLKEALHKAHIDGLDVTYSSCEILRLTGHKDPFHGPNVVCYNGQYQHEYLFQYLTEFQEQQAIAGRPYASFFITNVGHDDYGRRIQTLDQTLEKYLHFIKHQENTINIILSDHGNGYGSFVEETVEGRIEIFHPFLFMIIPNRVSEKLGAEKMQALKINQNRLTSILDVHYSIRTILGQKFQTGPKVTPNMNFSTQGLFQELPATRSCNDIPRLSPNLCICEGHYAVVNNDSNHLLLAEFALGQLNNLITQQFVSANRDTQSGHGMCQRLVASRIKNILESRQINSNKNYQVNTKFDLLVETPDTKLEIFFVTVRTNTKTSGKTEMELISYERHTSYSKYAPCADNGVDLKLCICTVVEHSKQNLNSKNLFNPKPIYNILFNPQKVLGVKTEVFGILKDKNPYKHCFYILARKHATGACLEMANTCDVGSRMGFEIEFRVELVNMDSSIQQVVRVTLVPNQIKFVMVVTQTVRHLDWQFTYSVGKFKTFKAPFP